MLQKFKWIEFTGTRQTFETIISKHKLAVVVLNKTVTSKVGAISKVQKAQSL